MKSIDFLRENAPPQKPQKPHGGKDPNKIVALKVWADPSFPPQEKIKMGRIDMNNPQSTARVRDRLVELLSAGMSNTNYINLAAQPDADVMVNWLLDRYSRGIIDYEDASGEAVDALAKWAALRNQPPNVGRKNNRFPTDVNSFQTLTQLKMLVEDEWYAAVLRRLQDMEEINKHKRTSKEVVLIDNPRYRVSIPMNYGACYLFNNAEGKQANFCTGGSSGLSWFNRYAHQGPLIMVTDKTNIEKVDGKWQIHAPTNQIVNAEQESRWDTNGNSSKFGTLFPGLMQDIVREMKLRKDDISSASKDIEYIGAGGYDVDEAVKNLRSAFPGAFTDHTEDTAQNK